MYHPDYFAGREDGHRQECWKRLDLLREHIKGGSLLDLGCSEGFYSFGLGDTCYPIRSIEKDIKSYGKCLRAQKECGVDVEFINGDILEEPFPLKWDNILYMSVHHHIIEQVGIGKATEFLNALSCNNPIMFFDIGQKNENCPEHLWHRLLPDTDDPEAWTHDYLEKNTEYKNITNIGSSPIHGIQRILWKLDNG